MLYSSKLAAVLRKLHNANDMLQTSAYETDKADLPNVDAISVSQLKDESQMEIVEQLSHVPKESQDTVVNDESTNVSKVRSDLNKCIDTVCI